MTLSLPAIDTITGLLDRKAGPPAVARLVSGATAAGLPPAVIWLDIDRFQQANQSFGHLGGDRIIAIIAERIRQCLPPSAEAFRMGSDEFMCLLPDCGKARAEQQARGLLEAIEAPVPIDDLQFRPSVSIGIAIHNPDEDALSLLERSDRAMLEAKRQGGNGIVISGDEPVPGRLGILLAREELSIEADLHTALENGGLTLHYQPILTPDGSLHALEALMRCHANGRDIPPDKFIPVAEKTGLIIRLGEWSLLQGASFAARLKNMGRPTRIAVNVSRLQLTSPKFIQALHGAIICANIPAELLELEVTESLFMDLSDTVQKNLKVARDMGIGLAIDDFGTGYSCLSIIKDLPATQLKLDRAFVRVLPEDRRSFSVVKAMTGLAQELGMKVVAEGVETREQLDDLLAAGVDAIQGFLNARPMDEQSVLEWLIARDNP